MKIVIAAIAVVVVLSLVWFAMRPSSETVDNSMTNTDVSGMTFPPSPTIGIPVESTPMMTTGTMSTSPSPMVSGTTAKAMTVSLAQLNTSGQTGTATLTETGGKVTVKITLTGQPTGSDEPAHIHVGSCPTPGAVKYPLTNVKNGTSTTILDTTLAKLQTEMPLAINVHKSASEMSVYTVCGDLGM